MSLNTKNHTIKKLPSSHQKSHPNLLRHTREGEHTKNYDTQRRKTHKKEDTQRIMTHKERDTQRRESPPGGHSKKGEKKNELKPYNIKCTKTTSQEPPLRDQVW